jgi:hypothetical protein
MKMSEESKKKLERTKRELSYADEPLEQASRFAHEAGDKKLAEKITKIRQDVETTKEDLSKKLKESNG